MTSHGSVTNGASARPPGTVAVLIAAYEASATLRRAIESALAQTHPPAQIIVVDDGSKDDTFAVAQGYAEQGVLTIRQANGGVSAARNRGLREVTSEFVAFLDADDWWAPEKLAVQVEVLRQHEDKIATYCGLMTVQAETGEQKTSTPPSPELLWPQLRWTNPFLPPSSMLMRTVALRSMGGFHEGLSGVEDWDLWIKVAHRNGFVASPEVLTYYQLSPAGLSGDAQKMFDRFLQLLDGPLLEGLSGWKRAWWRRRVVGFQMFKAALTARAKGDLQLERRFMRRSLMAWPSPFWPPQRVKCAAVTFLRRG